MGTYRKRVCFECTTPTSLFFVDLSVIPSVGTDVRLTGVGKTLLLIGEIRYFCKIYTPKSQNRKRGKVYRRCIVYNQQWDSIFCRLVNPPGQVLTRSGTNLPYRQKDHPVRSIGSGHHEVNWRFHTPTGSRTKTHPFYSRKGERRVRPCIDRMSNPRPLRSLPSPQGCLLNDSSRCRRENGRKTGGVFDMFIFR